MTRRAFIDAKARTPGCCQVSVAKFADARQARRWKFRKKAEVRSPLWFTWTS